MAKSSVPAVLPGASAHYQHGADYAARYASRAEDIDYYLRRCRGANSVVEFGAGTGRFTIPLARAGVNVLATDVAQPMLDVLRERLATEPAQVRGRVEIVLADARTFRTRRRFDAAVAVFHTINHMYSVPDVEQFLASVWRHLRPRGRFLFDMPLPRVDMPGYDSIAQVRVTHIESSRGAELLTQRCFFPCEIEMHLHYGGFSEIDMRADYQADDVVSDSDVVVVSCKKTSRGRRC